MDLSSHSVHRDKQLWLYEGDGFCLPVFIREITTPNEDSFLWLVWPALNFIHPAHKLFYQRMEEIAAARSDKFLVFDDPQAVSKTFRQAYGITPEFYYVWPGDRPYDESERVAPDDVPPAEAEEIPKDIDDEFLKEVVARTQLCSLDAMRIIFRAITQVAVHWMLAKRKPINFGFMTLFAVPYRQNWKSIILGAFPKSYSIFSMPLKRQPDAIITSGIADAFSSRQLLDVAPITHWFHWKLEVIPSRLWDSVVERVETQRVSSGRSAYANFIVRTITRQRDLIAAAYRYFICRSAQPCGRFDPMAPEGSQIIIPHTPKGGVRPKPLAYSSATVVVDRTLDYKRPKFSELVEREIDALHRLPNVRQQIAELRITGGYLDAPKKE